MAASLADLALKTSNDKLNVLAKTLDQATSHILKHKKSPSRVVNELDTRGSHFYLALYWAQTLAAQSENPELQEEFRGLARALTENESTIVDELNAAQGQPVDVGGYYHPDDQQAFEAMRPSRTFNALLNTIHAKI